MSINRLELVTVSELVQRVPEVAGCGADQGVRCFRWQQNRGTSTNQESFASLENFSLEVFTKTLHLHSLYSFLLPSATKLRQGNIFTPVCHSVHEGVSASVHAGIHPLWQTPPMGRQPPPTTAVNGTHPTGMHSCLNEVQNQIVYYCLQQSWGKVIFSQASVILSTGGLCLVQGVVPGLGGSWSGGTWSGGVHGPREGGCLVQVGGAWSRRGVPGLGGCMVLGGAWWRPPLRQLLLREVRILLECILVLNMSPHHPWPRP